MRKTPHFGSFHFRAALLAPLAVVVGIAASHDPLFAAERNIKPAKTTMSNSGPEISRAEARPKPAEDEIALVAAAFEDLPGWPDDDHLAALQTFGRSCGRVLAAVRSGTRNGMPPTPGLLSACEDAQALLARDTPVSRDEARRFFESHFLPHRVVHAGLDGLLTGYYEPVVAGSRDADARYRTPLLKRPADLVNLVAESERGAKAEQLTHARKTDTGTEPYPTRQEIEEGALGGRALELVYLEDPVDVFFMQVQGSGLVALPDGRRMRVTYDGKNGHPYTSIGRYLIDQGLFPADRMSLQALKQWLRENPERMREVLWQNRSYVFFRELSGAQAEAAMGVLEIPLTPGRSLAIDTRFHAIGTPVYVASDALRHFGEDKRPFERLMIAQDVGSAIRGPERGDIFFGTGDAAGSRAGITKHRGNFFVLLAREALQSPTIDAAGSSGSIRQARQ